jgi:hypothetical protein
MKHFLESTSGRLLTLAVALPLATGASTTWSPEGLGMVFIIASIFAGIMLAFVGIGSAVGEFDSEALWAILVLPPALLLYTPAVSLASTFPMIRVAMAMAAVILLGMSWRSILSSLRVASPRRATIHST